MQFLSTSLFLLPSLVSAHGYVSSPPSRTAGDASDAACGSMAMDDIRQDNTSHVEGLPELAAQDSGYDGETCNLWLCKGMQFGDNSMNVQTYSPGEEVNMKVFLRIPHDGSANVSVVDTVTNEIIGEMLNLWEEGYANEQLFYGDELPESQLDFVVTMPDVGDRCVEPGQCVLQWWWWGVGAKQTYESCVDFVMTSEPMGDEEEVDSGMGGGMRGGSP